MHPSELRPGEVSPNVRFEPCAAYRGGDATGCCEDCGWLEHDHELAAVVALPVRRRVVRRAS